MRSITQIKVVITAALFTILGCSTMDDDVNVNTSNQSLKEIMRENGNNPDEKVFSSRPRATVYVYTESNGADVNAIHIYKRTPTGDLEFLEKVNSGGIG